MKADPADIDIIAPNFKRRLSGVTSTVARLVPLQARSLSIATCAPNMPEDVPNVSWPALLTMSRKRRVWHARRNVEMLAGIALKRLLRKDLALVFTSASQRTHSAYTKWLIGQMDEVIATSGKTAGYLDRPSTVILHGIDTGTFCPHEDRATLRRELGLPSGGPLVGCFGRIRAQKGTDVFVEAMIAACSENADLTAVVMGRATGRHKDFLEGLVRRVADAGFQDRILFLPEVPAWETVRFYQALDLYVAPQRWEGFGLTPLEAMATGCPVVATRVGAFEEMVTPQTGTLVPAGDAAAIREAVLRILTDPEAVRAMRQSARAHMLENFRIEGEAEAISAVYRRLLQRP